MPLPSPDRTGRQLIVVRARHAGAVAHRRSTLAPRELRGQRREFTLRTIARVMGVAPALLGLTYARGGKPRLTARFVGPVPHFSVAHTSGVSLIALTYACPVGVDVEAVDVEMDYIAIARDLFGVELDTAGLTAPEIARMGCQWWVELEARQKVLGEGVAALFLPGPPRGVRRECYVHSVPVDMDRVGAVATCLEGLTLRIIDLAHDGSLIR